ncbi:MAG: NAD-dependent epimerase/dehydratase family protein, partial [Desulfobacterales bacterium]|nr:NAD-dependent epimerase/dehydratase family protein [Desulfobacterales bacterium]
MEIRGKKFLVIGGAGFIGSHLVDQLAQEDVVEIRVFDNFIRGSVENLAEALKDPRVRRFELGGELLHRDILDAAMKGIDGVFHLAALWLLHCYDFPRSAFEVNIGGTFNVLEAMLNNGVKRLVYSSSASVYGDAVEEPMTENHPHNNTNFYGATKIAGEHMCRSLYHRYRDTDKHFNYVGLRYMNVYGPRQDYHGTYIAVIMKILDRLDMGLPPIVYGDGSQAYDFIYVGDCARANLCAMKSDVTDSFFNVGTGIKTTIKELAELILEVTGSDLKVQYEPGGLTFVKNRVGCPKKAEAEINFEAKVQLRNGLKKLIDWRNSHKAEVARRRQEVGIEKAESSQVEYGSPQRNMLGISRGGHSEGQAKLNGSDSVVRKIPLIKPYITQEVKDKVCDVLDSGYLTEGDVTRELEQAFRNYAGCEYAIAATSCTT